MSTEPGDAQQSALWRALQELSRDMGVRRLDLFDELHPGGVLSELQRCWRINLGNGPEFARRAVEGNLNTHIAFLKPARSTLELTADEKTEMYLHTVNVCFNLSAPPDVARRAVDARRKWLAEEAPPKLRASASTSQRYLANAISQIEVLILASDYEPLSIEAVPESAAIATDFPVQISPVSYSPEPVAEHFAPTLSSAPVRTDSATQQVREPSVPVVVPASPEVVPAPQPDREDRPSLVETATPEGNPRKRLGRRELAILTAAGLVAVIAGGGITYAMNQHSEKAGNQSGAQIKGVAGGIPAGNFLAISNTDAYTSDLETTASAVFPAGTTAPHNIFTQSQMPGELPSESQLAADEMAAGGYLIGGAIITADVRAVGSVQATIHNVRVVNLKRQPIVTGDAFIIYPQGGANEQVLFMLDDAVPIGHVAGGQDAGKPWSQVEHSNVTSGTNDTFTISFVALRYAYTLNVAFDYDVNGKNYTQLVNGDGGKPLLIRVSADLCPPSEYRSQLTATQMASLGNLRYSRLHSNLMTNYYSVADVDPKLYSPNGIACPSYPKNKTGQGK